MNEDWHTRPEPLPSDPDHESHFSRPAACADFGFSSLKEKPFFKESFNEPEDIELLIECQRHTDLFGKTFMPDAFTVPFCTDHRKIFDLIDDDSKRQVVVAAPRGFGKTTISMTLMAKHICYRTSRFIVPLSASVSQCVLQSENLKEELESNDYIQRVFGPMKSDKWSRERWVTQTGTMVYPRGAEQKLRGIKWGHVRPNLFVIDDLEDDEAVMNPERRQKLKEWFFGAMKNSINKLGGWWRVIVIGTVMHEDSLLLSLINSDSWESEVLEICDDEGHSNWPEHTTDEEIKTEQEEHREQGMIHIWYREKRNMVISPEDCEFDAKFFKDYDEKVAKLSQQDQVRNCIIVDPAQTTKVKSAHSAVVCVGIDRRFQRIYLRDIDAGAFHPDELYEKIFAMAARFNCHMLAVEVNALHEFIVGPIENAMRMTGHYMTIEEINQVGDKAERVRALAPYYRYGLIYHERSIAHLIEEQLVTFPRSKRLDIADAFANVVPLMKRFNVTMLKKPKQRYPGDAQPQWVRPFDPPGTKRNRYGYLIPVNTREWEVCP
jgi:hypothetical protein